MRPKPSRFYLGQVVRVQVVEIQPEGYIVVSLDGALLQVHNQTAQRVVIGQTLELKVTSVNPAQFQLQMRQPGRLKLLA